MAAAKKRYEYKLTLGKVADGKPIRKSFYSTKSMSDAKRKADQYRLQYEMEHCLGVGVCVKRETFSSWAVTCLELYKKPYVKANTYSGTYLAPAENHLIPYFGKMVLDDIRPFHIQKYINQAAEKYSPETVKKDYTVLQTIFQTAVDNQLCSNTPMVKSIRLPAYQPVLEKQAYSQEEYKTVYDFAQKHLNGLAIMLLLETGISRSELLGLKWGDLDLEQGQLHIRQGLVSYRSEDQNKWVSESDGLKNKYRQRVIPLVEEKLLKRLAAHPREVLVNKKYLKTEYIFYSPQGKPYQPNNWANRIYRPFFEDLHQEHPEIPQLSAHELRHTRATLWIAQGIDPYLVARLLGHSDLKMLTKIYDHTSPETLRKAIESTVKKN